MSKGTISSPDAAATVAKVKGDLPGGRIQHRLLL
jgi:hypothetical protein